MMALHEFNGVQKFLKDHGFSQYWDIFKAKGFDRETDLLDLNESDLQNMQIPAHHIRPILDAGTCFKSDKQYTNIYTFKLKIIILPIVN